MSAETDYRRLTLEGAAARELKVPVAAPAAANSAPSAPAAPDGTAAAAAARAPAAAGGGAVPAAAQGRGGAGGGGLGGERLYLWPLGPAADAELERLWRNASGGAAAAAVPVAGSEAAGRGAAAGGEAVPVLFGRQLAVPRAAGGAAWVSQTQPRACAAGFQLLRSARAAPSRPHTTGAGNTFHPHTLHAHSSPSPQPLRPPPPPV